MRNLLATFQGKGAPDSEAPVKSRLRQNVESLGLAVLVALVVRASVVEAFWVPSGSMLPTIQIGDHLFVNKLAYGFQLLLVDDPLVQWSSPSRGDIVVFTSPADNKTDLIKRVIAVAGDTVEIRNRQLFINGEKADDPHAVFLGEATSRPQTPRDNFGPTTVPEGKFFVLGDNRDHSFDSRFWGFANEKDIKGKATFVYWSRDAKVSWMPRWERFGHFLR